MKRIEFRLTMPGRGQAVSSRWGEGRNYVLYRTLMDARAEALFEGHDRWSWLHHWPDGWVAQVSARVLAPGERKAKSDGFAGYDWMVTNILDHGETEFAR